MKISSLCWVITLSSCLSFALPPQAKTPAKAPATPAPAQAATAEPTAPNRGQAYYHYSLAHMYQELAIAYNRQDYVTKATDHLRLAMKYDPASTFLPVELAQTLWETGRTAEAVTECEDLIKRNPGNVEARRLLGRIYVRNLSEMGQQGQPAKRGDQAALIQRATDQFVKITELDPKDIESLITLGRLYTFSNDSVKAEAAFKRALALDPENDEALVTLASLYSDLGQNKQASELLERASAHNQHPRLLAMLAKSYEDNHDYPKAVAALRRALEQDKDNPELKKMLAQDILQSGQGDEEALKLFQDVVAANPQDPETYLMLGKIYRQKGQFAKALDAFKKADALSPDSLEITYNLALLQETQGSYDEAVRLLKKLLEDTAHPGANPTYTVREKANRAIFTERLGYVYRMQGKYKESEAAYRQTIDLDPENAAHSYVELMNTLRAAHEPQRAKAESDIAVKRFPDDQALRMARGTLIADMGNVDAGAKEIRSLLAAMKPEDTDERREIYLALSQIYEHARRFDEAVDAVKEADKLASSKEQKEIVYYFWGGIYEHAKKIDEAEAQFRRALALNPDSAMTLNYFGYMLADTGTRLDEAVKMISRALELEPARGEYMDSLGWAYFKQARYDLAEQYLLKASQKQGADPTIKDHLADLYFKTNRYKEALQQWTSALAEWKNSLPGDTDPLDVAKVEKKVEEAKVRLAKEAR